MVAVEADKHEIRVSIPTDGMPPEAVKALVSWLRAEFTARRSQLSDQAAWQVAEEVKADWWVKNQGRFTEPKP